MSFNYFREINAKNFTIANAGNVILNTARSTRIENNLSVSNSAKFDFSQDALEDSDKAGLHVGGNFTASNLEELRGWKANGLYVGGNFEMSGLKKIDMPSMGVNKAFDGYTASSENGINVAGNMTLAGVGDAASGGSAMFQEAAFLHVGKSLSLVDMKNNASFYNIGSYNGSVSGGIDGTGVLYGMDLDDSGLAHSSTIILNTAENSSFFGHMIWFNSAAWDSTQIHIVKNGAASQKFVINAVDNKWNGSVTVNEGIFEMFLMPGSFTKVDVILNGGSLSVAYSTTGRIIRKPTAWA